MRPSTICLLIVTACLASCGTLKTEPEPMPPTCPAPPKLPSLPAFDRTLLEGSFLDDLESGMFEAPTGQTPSEPLPPPASGSTTTPRLRSTP